MPLHRLKSYALLLVMCVVAFGLGGHIIAAGLISFRLLSSGYRIPVTAAFAVFGLILGIRTACRLLKKEKEEKERSDQNVD